MSGISNTLLQTLQELGLTEKAHSGMNLSRMLYFNINTHWSDVISFYHTFLNGLSRTEALPINMMNRISCP